MCLKSKTPDFSVTEKDMLVFKVVRREILTVKKDGRYGVEVVLKGCVYNAKYTYGEIYSEPEFGIDIDVRSDPKHDDVYLVGKGYHSYMDYSDASITAELLEEYDILKRQHIVLKCMIPKGTPYFISEDTREICSKAIKILEYPLQIPNFANA